MLSKIVKPGFLLLIAALLLAGCATTSDPEPEKPAPFTPKSAFPAPAPAADPVSTSTARAPAPAPIILGRVVYFDFDQSALRPEARSLLVAHAKNLKANPRSLRLEGHADERGTREYNMALGERRALAVRDFLRSEGVNSAIEVVSYGEERPVNTASNEAAWLANRRVEIIK